MFKAKDMELASSSGLRDSISKASGRTAKRKDTESGDPRKEMSMKVSGKTTGKMAKEPTSTLEAPNISATSKISSNTAEARNNLPTETDMLAITARENLMATEPTPGLMEISTREIFSKDPAKAKAPSSIKTVLSIKVIFSMINATGRASRNTRKDSTSKANFTRARRYQEKNTPKKEKLFPSSSSNSDIIFIPLTNEKHTFNPLLMKSNNNNARNIYLAAGTTRHPFDRIDDLEH